MTIHIDISWSVVSFYLYEKEHHIAQVSIVEKYVLCWITGTVFPWNNPLVQYYWNKRNRTEIVSKNCIYDITTRLLPLLSREYYNIQQTSLLITIFILVTLAFTSLKNFVHNMSHNYLINKIIIWNNYGNIQFINLSLNLLYFSLSELLQFVYVPFYKIISGRKNVLQLVSFNFPRRV